jgi:hypothetical protein
LFAPPDETAVSSSTGLTNVLSHLFDASPAPETDYPDIATLTFEEHKVLGLDITQQYDLVSRIRDEIPLMQAQEADNLLLNSIAKQLEL